MINFKELNIPCDYCKNKTTIRLILNDCEYINNLVSFQYIKDNTVYFTFNDQKNIFESLDTTISILNPYKIFNIKGYFSVYLDFSCSKNDLTSNKHFYCKKMCSIELEKDAIIANYDLLKPDKSTTKLDLTISGYNRFIITCGNGITKIQHKDYKNFTTKEMMIPVILKLDKVNYSSVENILSHFQKYLILK